MTDQEAMEILKKPCLCDYDLSKTIFDCDIEQCDKRDAVLQAIKALEEVQTYQAIGTSEECRAAMEKQKAKKPIEPDEEYGTFKCPNCGGLIFTENRFETHKHCLLCGQKLDWSDEDDT